MGDASPRPLKDPMAPGPERSSLQYGQRFKTYSSVASPPASPPPSPPASPKPEIEEGKWASLAAASADPTLRAQFKRMIGSLSSDSEDDADEPKGKGKDDDDELPAQGIDEVISDAQNKHAKKSREIKNCDQNDIYNAKLQELGQELERELWLSYKYKMGVAPRVHKDDADEPDGKGKDDNDEWEDMHRLLV